ncbi:MAG: hypothetical protein CFK52_14155 [Chloracidobacterium sp. CP2_5A]|nr:MAG: hypothetical protein CFK52_14155 [Chloracidobacterium sp. CP2_5A]
MAGLTRLPDWEERLLRLIEASCARPYELGEWDCAQFAGAAVEAVTGVNPAARYLGRYRTAASGLRLARAGRGGIVAAVTRALGDPVAPLRLRRGDLCLHGSAVGCVWAGGGLFVGQDGARDGLVLIALDECSSGWRVG